MTSSDHEKKTEKKKTKGKLKIEIKKIEKSSSRHVTFSKRRAGLFKKASELSVTTGAQVGILVESVSGKHVYSYGNPDIVSLIDRFEKIHPDATRLKQKEEDDTICKDLEVEKEKEKENKGIEGNFWWNMDVKDLDYEELQKHLAALELLKENVIKRAENLAKAENLKVVEGRSKVIQIQPSDSTSTATSVSGGDYRGLDRQPPASVDCVLDRSAAGNSSNAPSIGSVIDDQVVVAAVDDVSGTHEELDLELRL